MKPLDIYDKMSGHCPGLSAATNKDIFDKMAAKQETTVRDDVSMLVNMKPLDIYEKMSGHCPGVNGNIPDIFDKVAAKP